MLLNLEPSIIYTLIILEGFPEIINSIKKFYKCVCVYVYSLCVPIFLSSSLILVFSTPHSPLPTHLYFCKTMEMRKVISPSK